MRTSDLLDLIGRTLGDDLSADAARYTPTPPQPDPHWAALLTAAEDHLATGRGPLADLMGHLTRAHGIGHANNVANRLLDELTHQEAAHPHP